MIRWPLARWVDKVGVASATRREATLGNKFHSDRTDLGSLRRFVASLEKWPDSATVEKASGAMVCVEWFDHADPLLADPNQTIAGTK